jgi:hypothetical protein
VVYGENKGHFSPYLLKCESNLKNKWRFDPYSDETVYIMWFPVKIRGISPSIY